MLSRRYREIELRFSQHLVRQGRLVLKPMVVPSRAGRDGTGLPWDLCSQEDPSSKRLHRVGNNAVLEGTPARIAAMGTWTLGRPPASANPGLYDKRPLAFVTAFYTVSGDWERG